MKYRVHAFMVVRVPVEVEAESQLDAIQAAEEKVGGISYQEMADYEAEAADEIVGWLVDEDGDEEHDRSEIYTWSRKPGLWIPEAQQ
jgi:hypothetical protein